MDKISIKGSTIEFIVLIVVTFWSTEFSLSFIASTLDNEDSNFSFIPSNKFLVLS